MRLCFSEHAAERMAQRGITEADIRTCLDNVHTSFRSNTSSVYIGAVEGRTLKVVVAADRDDHTQKFVITTYWKGDDGT